MSGEDKEIQDAIAASLKPSTEEKEMQDAIAASYVLNHHPMGDCYDMAFVMTQIASVWDPVHDHDLDEAIRLSLNEKTTEGKESKTSMSECNICCILLPSNWICSGCKFMICGVCVGKTFEKKTSCPQCRRDIAGSIVNGKILAKINRIDD